MPRILLTEEQRNDQRYAKLRRCIADRLATVKSRERLSQEQLAKRVGMSRSTMSRMLAGEVVLIDTTTWLRVLDVAGLALADRHKDAIKEEAER